MREKIDSLFTLMNEIHTELSERFTLVEKHENYLCSIREMQARDEMDTSILKLNVGGQLFETKRSTLLSPLTEDSMFYVLGSGWFESEDEKREGTFIDRDPDLFGIILHWLRHNTLFENTDDNEHEPPTTINRAFVSGLIARTQIMQKTNNGTKEVEHYILHCLKEEAQYYGLDKLVQVLEKQQGQVSTTVRASFSRVHKLYRLIQPNFVEYSTSDDYFLTPINVIILPGTHAHFTVEFEGTTEFEICVDDQESHSLMAWHSEFLEPLIGEAITIYKKYRLCVHVDFTGWDEVKGVYWVKEAWADVQVINTVTANRKLQNDNDSEPKKSGVEKEVSWKGDCDEEIGQKSKSGILNAMDYVVPFLGTVTKGSTIALLDISV